MPLAIAPAILNLLDGPVDVDPAFHVIWSRFRVMRRFLAYCPEEEPRIFWMLDLISRGARVMGLFIFFLFLPRSWGLLEMVMSKVGFGFLSLLCA